MAVGIDIALSAAKSALAAKQKEMAVISNNIANAGNTSYHRQTATLESNVMVGTTDGYYGTGSHVSQVTRAYDAALESSLRIAQSSYSYRELYYEKLGNIEDLMSPSGTSALDESIQDYAAALQDVAASPESSSARSALQGAAKTLADAFNQQYSSLASMRDSIAANTATGTGTIKDTVDNLNDMLKQVVSLNDSIANIESNGFIGQSANDLRDQRDALVSEISKSVSISVKEETNGKYTVSLNTEGSQSSYTLIDGSSTPSRPANTLELTMTAPVSPSPNYTPQIVLHDNSYNTSTNITLAENSGEIRAMMDAREYVTDKMDEVYTLASRFGDSTVEPRDWAGSTAKAAGDYIIPDPPNGYAYVCSSAGTTGAAQPSAWPATIGASVTDGSVTWTAVRLSEVNAAHMEGFDLNGDRGGKFFDLTADQPASGNILSVSAGVANSSGKIAASSAAGTNGNGSNMTNMWNVMNKDDTSGTSILARCNSIISEVSQDVSNAKKYSETTENIVTMFTNSVNEVSSVNMDDELTTMLEVQRAYQANAKLITALDEMMQTVLSIK